MAMIRSLVYLTLVVVASAAKIDLGAGNFLKRVCSPSHPASLSGDSDYICTLKERDFYPESIGNTIQGLEVMAQADMVKDLQMILARNLLKLKRERSEEFEGYKRELGEEEFEGIVWNLIQGGWATETFDYGFELYEEFEMDSRVLINKATSLKLIERMSQRKPTLTVKLFDLLTGYEKILAVLNDSTGIVLKELSNGIKARSSNLKTVFSELSPYICQSRSGSSGSGSGSDSTFDIFNVFDIFDENDANILKSIYEICYGSDTNKAIELYQNLKENESQSLALIVESALKSNNFKTTNHVLKLEEKTEILNVLNLFSSEKEQEIVLKLLKETRENFIYLEREEMIKIIIENALESKYPETGTILVEAINSLQTVVVQVNLHLRGLGKVYINSNIKSAIKANPLIKFKFTSKCLATLIKEDHLFPFIEEFGQERFFNTFTVDKPQILLTYLNKPEDFHSAFQLFNLKSGNKLYESDFLVENVSSALEIFHQTREDASSQIFLIMRRAQIEYLISKFKADLFPKLPDTFVDILKKTQEL